VTFAVVWRQAALDLLADLYVTLPLGDQDRVAAGVKALNARLASDPFAVGEGRDDDHDRIAFPPLLSVTFEVDPAAGVVRVINVVRFGR
jgi:hypothetical protein